MSEMMNFTSWFLNELPTFLMAEPVKALWGVVLFTYLFKGCIAVFRH